METDAEMFTRSLRCPLNTDEVRDRGGRLASLVGKVGEMRQQAGEDAANRRAAIKEKEGEIARLSAEVRDQATFRDIDCERLLNYTAGTVTERRLDTSEELSCRAMTYSERQLSMPLESEEPEAIPDLASPPNKKDVASAVAETREVVKDQKSKRKAKKTAKKSKR